MIVPISVSYKYKKYPLAPKATQKSKSLGVMTSFIAMALWSFFFVAVVAYVISMFGIEYETGMIASVVLLIPFIFCILKWKKSRVLKIDEYANEETKKNMVRIEMLYRATVSLAEPFTKDNIKQRCTGEVLNKNDFEFALQKLVEMGKLKREGRGKNSLYYRAR